MPTAPGNSIIGRLVEAARTRDRDPFLYCANQMWTFGEIFDLALVALGALQRSGVQRGDKVVLVGANEPWVVASLFGSMLGGVVPAIVHPPLRADTKSAKEQLAAIVQKAEPRLVVTPSKISSSVPDGVTVLTSDRIVVGRPGEMNLELLKPDALAYLQFSSGSTGNQKAVMISHAAMAANAQATAEKTRLSKNERWVSWLPLYHDMGLMAGLLVPLYLGHETVLLRTEAFLEQPMSWLQAISDHRGTLTAAPNFAYALAARRAKSFATETLDLSALRIAFNGAEPITEEAIVAFEKTFRKAKLRPNTVYPVYGLAEFTLSAAYWDVQTPIQVDYVSLLNLAHGHAQPAANNEVAVGFVSVGRVMPGHALRLVDTHGVVASERRVGEIQLRGASQMVGYLNDVEGTSEALSDGWLRTGDLGYRVGDNFFICGRQKELIIRFGENIYPQTVEAAALQVDGVKAGRVVAFGVHDPQLSTERLWLAVETDLQELDAIALLQRVRDALRRGATMGLDGISAVPPGFIEKTSSGKLRRLHCAEKLATLFRGPTPPPTLGPWPQPAKS